MKILLIGGSGFVSGTTAELAVREGHEVWVVTRGERPLPSGLSHIQADRRDRKAFANAVEAAGVQWDLVVDCIGYEPEDAVQDVEVFPGRAGHFVFISTDFVFDPRRRWFPQPEDGAYLTEGYGGKKRRCELEFLERAPGNMPWTILRPCHIYGPGSQLGCLPMHGRDPELIDRLKRGEPLKLVGAGSLLQQPILARDLAQTILSCPAAPSAQHRIFQLAGPDVVESRTYYEIIAWVLGVELNVEEIPLLKYREEHPEHASFLCHRFYDLSLLHEAGLHTPATPLKEGLRKHVNALAKDEA
jgi:nucleoside-diphosphate-sugar epimerase